MPPAPAGPVTRQDFLHHWLRSTPGAKYQHFTCTVLAENSGSRALTEKALGETVFVHHKDPAVYRTELARLGYARTAAVLERRPKSHKTRMGNFGEVIAAEFLRQLRGYEIPVYRLRYNTNDESSPKGDDVLAFEFADRKKGRRDTVVVAEVKVRTKFRSDAVEEAHEGLSKGNRPRPKSFSFVVDTLLREGRDDEGYKLLDLSQKFGKRSLVHRSCLFLITGNEPSSPFDCILDRPPISNLEAVQLALPELKSLVDCAFDAKVDANVV